MRDFWLTYLWRVWLIQLFVVASPSISLEDIILIKSLEAAFHNKTLRWLTPMFKYLKHSTIVYPTLGTIGFWLNDLWRVGLNWALQVACPCLSFETIFSWLNESWGDWLGSSDAQSDFPQTGHFSPNQVSQLAAFCWNFLDDKCWLANKIIH